MRLLLDTHVLLWWLNDAPVLGRAARDAIADPANLVYVSSMSFAEIAVKQGVGKLNGPYISDELLAEQEMHPLPLTPRHGRKLVELPLHHRDPFDRLLIAQAVEERLTVVTADSRFRAYGVPILDAAAPTVGARG